ncbi:MAG TPA: hypothetical protein VEK15_05235, partial [Vicinamibacteria bacterium]|nr:hypothetical protein [Vicinamibacteria bacterium]
MNVMKMAVGGIIGGLVGAAIWAAIGYFTGYEVGWIAWGVGALAGVGVRLVGTQRLANDTVAGAIAAIAAVASVLIGKYAVVLLFFVSPAESFSDYADEETMTAYLADEIAYDLESQGRAVDWPPGMD